AASKLLLALSLLWFYMWWAEFLTHWYGRTPQEQRLLALLDFGPYFPVWLLGFGLAVALPLALLIWNRVRRSITAATIVAVSILAGNFFDRVRVYVAAFSIEDVTARQLTAVPAARLP